MGLLLEDRSLPIEKLGWLEFGIGWRKRKFTSSHEFESAALKTKTRVVYVLFYGFFFFFRFSAAFRIGGEWGFQSFRNLIVGYIFMWFGFNVVLGFWFFGREPSTEPVPPDCERRVNARVANAMKRSFAAEQRSRGAEQQRNAEKRRSGKKARETEWKAREAAAKYKKQKKNKIKAKLETESLKAHSSRLALPHSLSLSSPHSLDFFAHSACLLSFVPPGKVRRRRRRCRHAWRELRCRRRRHAEADFPLPTKAAALFWVNHKKAFRSSNWVIFSKLELDIFEKKIKITFEF